jgi:Protein of unknown function (DUF2490)
VTRRARARGVRALSLGVTLMVGATASAAVTNEIWPEIDVVLPVTGSLRLLLTGSGTRDAEGGDRTQGAYAAFLDYRINQHISVRAGYEYRQRLKLATGARGDVEHRQMYDFNYSVDLRQDVRLTDRTRIDVRDRGGQTTYRLRNRLMFTGDLEVHRVRLAPYASGEVFYDTQYDRVDRLQFRLGTTLPTGPNVAWDFYLARQRDTQPATKFINALGVTLTVKY